MLHVLVESNTSALLLVKVLQREQQAGLVEIRCSAPRRLCTQQPGRSW